MSRRLLVTSALPYANGSIHFGHLVEYIQTDIWVRFQKMRGHEVHYVCADDTHGTAIMLRAEKEGITSEQLIARVYQEHTRDFRGFLVDFDHYGSTNDAATQAICYDIYRKLRDQAMLVTTRAVEQFFDPVKELFLPDRFIKGTCPKCGAKDQYGDSCEVCGSTYSPTDLIDPYSVVSGAKPIRKSSEHYFFKLSDPRCHEFLQQWTQQDDRLQPEAKNKIREWFDAGLNDWDISRDAPYFGFEIPDAPGKYFYVWLDAPIGYLGSFKNLCDAKGIDYSAFTDADKAHAEHTEMIHFIGKDILYFHALFWPATLQFSGYRTPTHVYAHGFLTVNGEKMSKSRGTFITAESYLKLGLNPEWLRYYYAAKLNSTMEDIDLNLDDFVARVNSDLVGKYVNIASRSATFITKHFGGEVADISSSPAWHGLNVAKHSTQVGDAYDEREYGKALRSAMEFADQINQYFDAQKPWDLAKDSTRHHQLHEVCSICVTAFQHLTLWLKPVLPSLAKNAEQFLNCGSLVWSQSPAPLKRIGEYRHLMSRVDQKQIQALVEANRENLVPTSNGAKTAKDNTKLPSPSGRGAGGEGKPRVPQDLRDFARELRAQQTDAESLIWMMLRDRRFDDLKFRRQHPVQTAAGNYILDFYCIDKKIAIELDGSQHFDQNSHDQNRTEALKQLGIRVLRYWNNDVLSNTEDVLQSIWQETHMNESNSPSPPAPLPRGEGSTTISIDEFMKIDLRVAKVVNAEHVEGAEKLIKLTLDIGTETRQVFAGIKAHYDPAKIIGRHVVMVANLAPRKMRFGESQGMVLAASGEDTGVFLLDVDSGGAPGMRVK